MPFIHGSPSASSRNWTQPYAAWRDSNAGAFFADRGSSLRECAAPGSPAHGPFCPVPCAGSGGDLPLPLLPPSCHHPPSSPVGGEFSRDQTHQEDDGHRPHPTHHRHGGPGHSCHHHRRLVEKHFGRIPKSRPEKSPNPHPCNGSNRTNRDQHWIWIQWIQHCCEVPQGNWNPTRCWPSMGNDGGSEESSLFLFRRGGHDFQR